MQYTSPRWGFFCRFAFSLPALFLVWYYVPRQKIKEKQTYKNKQFYKSVCIMCSKYHKTLLPMGLFLVCIYFIRIARRYILTIVAHSINLNESEIGLVNSISFFIDTLCFPFSGALMDTYGRKYSAMPGLFIMTSGYIFLY
eukprot:UN31959